MRTACLVEQQNESMQRAIVDVAAHDGMVEMTIRDSLEDPEPLMVILDPHDARLLGDKMFAAGCSASF
jgi:hypothetical protein